MAPLVWLRYGLKPPLEAIFGCSGGLVSKTHDSSPVRALTKRLGESTATLFLSLGCMLVSLHTLARVNFGRTQKRKSGGARAISYA